MGAVSWTMHLRRWNSWNFTAKLIQGARRQCAGPDYLFVASFGSRCLVQAWKKELLELDLLSQQPLGRSMRNIWLDCDRLPRRLATIEQGEKRPLQSPDPILKDGMLIAETSRHNRC
jgi:hypothetical protein